MIEYEVHQSGRPTEEFLRDILAMDVPTQLASYGAEGVSALKAHTPRRTGKTAESWAYEVIKESNGWSVIWTNDNIVDGRPVAILLQFDHMTGTGGFVEGTDYINPALQPLFDRISDGVRKVVTSA